MDKKLAQSFGKIIKELRMALGISQEKLAFDADLDRTYISMLEHGIRQPTIETLFRLAKCLNEKPSKIISKIER